jgi:hypothetical protein
MPVFLKIKHVPYFLIIKHVPYFYPLFLQFHLAGVAGELEVAAAGGGAIG